MGPASSSQQSAEEDARLMAKAHEIHRDKKRLKAVTEHHRHLGDALGSNAGSMATMKGSRKKKKRGSRSRGR